MILYIEAFVIFALVLAGIGMSLDGARRTGEMLSRGRVAEAFLTFVVGAVSVTAAAIAIFLVAKGGLRALEGL